MLNPEDMHKQDKAPNHSDLADLSAIRIREDLPHTEKVQTFLSEIKNPYRFLCGDVPVQVRFADDGLPLGRTLQDFFLHIKQG